MLLIFEESVVVSGVCAVFDLLRKLDCDVTLAVKPAVLFHLMPPLGSAAGRFPYLLRKALWYELSADGLVLLMLLLVVVMVLVLVLMVFVVLVGNSFIERRGVVFLSIFLFCRPSYDEEKSSPVLARLLLFSVGISNVDILRCSGVVSWLICGMFEKFSNYI